MPFNSRLAIPTRVPAGGNSTIAATSRWRMVSLHRSHRTGRVSWATSFSMASAAEATGWGPTVAANRVEPGAAGGSVVALRDRLVAQGYLPPSVSAVYDAPLTAAVKAFQSDHGLTVTGLAVIVLLALVLVDDDLLALHLAENFPFHLRARNGGIANLHALVAAQQKNVEADDTVIVLVEFLNIDGIAFGDAVLLATRYDYCVHG